GWTRGGRLRARRADDSGGLLPRANARARHGDFCGAIPVGSALGYVLGGLVNAQFGWRWAFYLVAIPGIILGLFCFFQTDPRARSGAREERTRATKQDYMALLRIRSFVINCLAQTAMTFALGGLAFWMSAYLIFRNQSPA